MRAMAEDVCTILIEECGASDHWYENREHLALLIRFLSQGEHPTGLDVALDSIEDVLYILEKPWKYEKEFAAALVWQDNL